MRAFVLVHQPQNSYLNISAIMSAVDLTGAEAIHPGYGFYLKMQNFQKLLQNTVLNLSDQVQKSSLKWATKYKQKELQKIWFTSY